MGLRWVGRSGRRRDRGRDRRSEPRGQAGLGSAPGPERFVQHALAREALVEAQDGALAGGEADGQVEPAAPGEEVRVALDVAGEVRQAEEEQVPSFA